MVVFKSHVHLIDVFSIETMKGFESLSSKHSLMILEDRKFVDIGNTVQQQYYGGALRISEFADIVNVSILGGEGIIEVLSRVVGQSRFPIKRSKGIHPPCRHDFEGKLANRLLYVAVPRAGKASE